MDLKVIGKQHIGKYEFTGIEGGFGKNKKSMLVKDIAKIHNQPLGEINRRINDNRKRFKDEIDIIDLKSVMGLSHKEFGYTQNAWNRSLNAYLLSERGYAKLLKILEDDKAWEIYDRLVDNYFNMRQAI
uniref:ORF6N domain-containing protein n=1 Tax=Liquorilactobacillus vini TaxID=238015 RepID=UPI0005588FD4